MTVMTMMTVMIITVIVIVAVMMAVVLFVLIPAQVAAGILAALLPLWPCLHVDYPLRRRHARHRRAGRGALWPLLHPRHRRRTRGDVEIAALAVFLPLLVMVAAPCQGCPRRGEDRGVLPSGLAGVV